jgi:DNA-3-methyladenine glycosylase
MIDKPAKSSPAPRPSDAAAGPLAHAREGRWLPPEFFNRPAQQVARDLLGKRLVRRLGESVVAAPVVETEAYVGPHDLACHAARGRTRRTEVMFAPPGTLYVYFIYGMHWMLNVVTGEEGYAAAVLIRGIEGAIGPGRLTSALNITGELNGLPAAPLHGLWFEDAGIGVPPSRVMRTPRIGIDYAGPVWSAKKLRFVLKSRAAKNSSRPLPKPAE